MLDGPCPGVEGGVDPRRPGSSSKLSQTFFPLRASSYEPGNRAGPVGGTNFVFCSYGKFNPGYRDEKCPKGHQNTRGTAFRPVSDLTSHAQLKMFRPGIRAGVFIWEEFKKFPARLPRSRSQKPRSRLPGQPAFS